LERPNGIGLSPDERTLYVVETPTARCWAFKLSAPGQIESANGPYRGEKGTVITGLGGYQMFDSLAVDGEGHICVATLITGAVSDIWPDGSRVDQYRLPDMMVTNVCFGGRDLRTAFATLSMGGTLVSFEWPRPGLPLNHLNTWASTHERRRSLRSAAVDGLGRRRRALPGGHGPPPLVRYQRRPGVQCGHRGRPGVRPRPRGPGALRALPGRRGDGEDRRRAGAKARGRGDA